MNLFALELDAVLRQHGYSLSTLYAVRAGSGAPITTPAKVARLQRSLVEDITAALSEGELTMLGAALSLEPREGRRLRAALTGEAIRLLLAQAMSQASAFGEGERVIELLVDEQEGLAETREEMRQMTGGRLRAADARGQLTTTSLSAADANAHIARALDSAAEACEQGEIWLSQALAAGERDRQEDLLGMARTALNRAATLLAYAPTVAQNSAIQQEWRQVIEAALASARQLRPWD